MSLHTILNRYYQPAGVMGRSSSAALERDLQRHARLNAIIYSILLGLMIATLLAVGWVLIGDIKAGQLTHTALLASAGVTFPVVLELVRRTVREWSQASLVALLSRKLDGPELRSMIEVLVEAGKKGAAV